MRLKFVTIFLLSGICLFGQNKAVKDTVTLDEIIITGTKIGIARNQIPFTVTQIPQKFIEQSGESALLNILGEYTPGVFVTKRGVSGFGVSTGAAGQINIRGIGSSPTTDVLVLVNGNPQFAGIFGHPLPDTYLSSDVEKVEIIRGPGSILYGSNAMGGVINIITKKQKDDGIHLNTRASFGSFNTYKFMFSSGYKKGDFGLRASFNREGTDGDRPSSDFKLTNGYLKTDYEIDEHFNLGADFSVSQTNASDPGAVSASTPGYKIDILRTNSNFSVSNQFEKISGSVHIFYNYGEHEITDGFSSIDRNYGLGVFQSLKLFDGNVITLGFDYKDYGGIAKNKKAMNGKGTTFADTTVNEKAGYALIQQSFNNGIVLNAGYRIENHSVYGNEYIPSAGIAYYFSNCTTIKASVSKGFRSPTIKELFLFTPANSNLKPERVTNYEIGLMQKLFADKLGLEITIFKADGENMIQTIYSGGVPKNVNSGSFKNHGLEFSAKFNQNNDLNYILNYTYIKMKNPVLATPEHSLYLGANYTFNKFNINLGLQNITNLTTLTSPTVQKESYVLLNTIISYNVVENFNIFLKAENILDESYEINYDYPMPGITIFGGINFHL
jgi:outer membrane cobalamin receptor